jgi:hypothetical protein
VSALQELALQIKEYLPFAVSTSGNYTPPEHPIS